MKPLSIVGIILVILGVLAFVVPVPQQQDHSLKVGDAKIGVQTQTHEKLPPAAGIVLLAGGIVTLALASRKS
jgi:uncharacterized membrane protein